MSGIEVEAVRLSDCTLKLRYWVLGDIGSLLIPPIAASVRTDELWRHTCFEAFLRAPPQDDYIEFNLAPSGQWASYRFESYRSVRRDLEVRPPEIEVGSDVMCFELRVAIEMSISSGLSEGSEWNIGLAAILEETNGSRSYWALAHPPGRPDFHRADCFALNLPPTSPA